MNKYRKGQSHIGAFWQNHGDTAIGRSCSNWQYRGYLPDFRVFDEDYRIIKKKKEPDPYKLIHRHTSGLCRCYIEDDEHRLAWIEGNRFLCNKILPIMQEATRVMNQTTDTIILLVDDWQVTGQSECDDIMVVAGDGIEELQINTMK